MCMWDSAILKLAYTTIICLYKAINVIQHKVRIHWGTEQSKHILLLYGITADTIFAHMTERRYSAQTIPHSNNNGMLKDPSRTQKQEYIQIKMYKCDDLPCATLSCKIELKR